MPTRTDGNTVRKKDEDKRRKREKYLRCPCFPRRDHCSVTLPMATPDPEVCPDGRVRTSSHLFWQQMVLQIFHEQLLHEDLLENSYLRCLSFEEACTEADEFQKPRVPWARSRDATPAPSSEGRAAGDSDRAGDSAGSDGEEDVLEEAFSTTGRVAEDPKFYLKYLSTLAERDIIPNNPQQLLGELGLFFQKELAHRSEPATRLSAMERLVRKRSVVVRRILSFIQERLSGSRLRLFRFRSAAETVSVDSTADGAVREDIRLLLQLFSTFLLSVEHASEITVLPMLDSMDRCFEGFALMSLRAVSVSGPCLDNLCSWMYRLSAAPAAAAPRASPLQEMHRIRAIKSMLVLSLLRGNLGSLLQVMAALEQLPTRARIPLSGKEIELLVSLGCLRRSLPASGLFTRSLVRTWRLLSDTGETAKGPRLPMAEGLVGCVAASKDYLVVFSPQSGLDVYAYDAFGCSPLPSFSFREKWPEDVGTGKVVALSGRFYWLDHVAARLIPLQLAGGTAVEFLSTESIPLRQHIASQRWLGFSDGHHIFVLERVQDDRLRVTELGLQATGTVFVVRTVDLVIDALRGPDSLKRVLATPLSFQELVDGYCTGLHLVLFGRRSVGPSHLLSVFVAFELPDRSMPGELLLSEAASYWVEHHQGEHLCYESSRNRIFSFCSTRKRIWEWHNRAPGRELALVVDSPDANCLASDPGGISPALLRRYIFSALYRLARPFMGVCTAPHKVTMDYLESCEAHLYSTFPDPQSPLSEPYCTVAFSVDLSPVTISMLMQLLENVWKQCIDEASLESNGLSVVRSLLSLLLIHVYRLVSADIDPSSVSSDADWGRARETLLALLAPNLSMGAEIRRLCVHVLAIGITVFWPLSGSVGFCNWLFQSVLSRAHVDSSEGELVDMFLAHLWARPELVSWGASSVDGVAVSVSDFLSRATKYAAVDAPRRLKVASRLCARVLFSLPEPLGLGAVCAVFDEMAAGIQGRGPAHLSDHHLDLAADLLTCSLSLGWCSLELVQRVSTLIGVLEQMGIYSADFSSRLALLDDSSAGLPFWVSLLETPHPYKRRSNERFPVSFAGAESIYIYYDPRSRTRTTTDCLDIFSDDTLTHCVESHSVLNFPRGPSNPVSHPFSALVFRFRSEYTACDWGFKAVCRAPQRPYFAPAQTSSLDTAFHAWVCCIMALARGFETCLRVPLLRRPAAIPSAIMSVFTHSLVDPRGSPVTLERQEQDMWVAALRYSGQPSCSSKDSTWLCAFAAVCKLLSCWSQPSASRTTAILPASETNDRDIGLSDVGASVVKETVGLLDRLQADGVSAAQAADVASRLLALAGASTGVLLEEASAVFAAFCMRNLLSDLPMLMSHHVAVETSLSAAYSLLACPVFGSCLWAAKVLVKAFCVGMAGERRPLTSRSGAVSPASAAPAHPPVSVRWISSTHWDHLLKILIALRSHALDDNLRVLLLNLLVLDPFIVSPAQEQGLIAAAEALVSDPMTAIAWPAFGQLVSRWALFRLPLSASRRVESHVSSDHITQFLLKVTLSNQRVASVAAAGEVGVVGRIAFEALTIMYWLAWSRSLSLSRVSESRLLSGLLLAAVRGRGRQRRLALRLLSQFVRSRPVSHVRELFPAPVPERLLLDLCSGAAADPHESRMFVQLLNVSSLESFLRTLCTLIGTAKLYLGEAAEVPTRDRLPQAALSTGTLPEIRGKFYASSSMDDMFEASRTLSRAPAAGSPAVHGSDRPHTASYRTVSREFYSFDISDEACRPFGFLHQDRVHSPNGPSTVVGVRDGRMWFHVDSDDGASYWGSCRSEADHLSHGFFLIESARALDAAPEHVEFNRNSRPVDFRSASDAHILAFELVTLLQMLLSDLAWRPFLGPIISSGVRQLLEMSPLVCFRSVGSPGVGADTAALAVQNLGCLFCLDAGCSAVWTARWILPGDVVCLRSLYFDGVHSLFQKRPTSAATAHLFEMLSFQFGIVLDRPVGSAVCKVYFPSSANVQPVVQTVACGDLVPLLPAASAGPDFLLTCDEGLLDHLLKYGTAEMPLAEEPRSERRPPTEAFRSQWLPNRVLQIAASALEYVLEDPVWNCTPATMPSESLQRRQHLARLLARAMSRIRPLALVPCRSGDGASLGELARSLLIVERSLSSIVLSAGANLRAALPGAEQTLPFSAARGLPVPSPSCVANEYVRNARLIPGSQRRTIEFSATVPPKRNLEAALARANAPIPDSCAAFYFEVRVDALPSGSSVAAGLCPIDPKTGILEGNIGMPGWYGSSYGYHSDDGGLYFGSRATDKWDPYRERDVVGVGLLKSEASIFLTRNGRLLGTAFRNVVGRFVPVFGLHGKGCRLTINFGQDAFEYPFDESTVRADLAAAGSCQAGPPQPLPSMVVQVAHSGNSRPFASSGGAAGDSARPPSSIASGMVSSYVSSASASVSSLSQSMVLPSSSPSLAPPSLDPRSVTSLVALGFSQHSARYALSRFNHHLESAANWLLENGEVDVAMHLVEDVTAHSVGAPTLALGERSAVVAAGSHGLQPLAASARGAVSAPGGVSLVAEREDRYPDAIQQYGRMRRALPLNLAFWVQDVDVGMSLRVAAAVSGVRDRAKWEKLTRNTRGRIGLVRQIDAQRKWVLLEFFDSERSTRFCWWYPVAFLERAIAVDLDLLDAMTNESLSLACETICRDCSVLLARHYSMILFKFLAQHCRSSDAELDTALVALLPDAAGGLDTAILEAVRVWYRSAMYQKELHGDEGMSEDLAAVPREMLLSMTSWQDGALSRMCFVAGQQLAGYMRMLRPLSHRKQWEDGVQPPMLSSRDILWLVETVVAHVEAEHVAWSGEKRADASAPLLQLAQQVDSLLSLPGACHRERFLDCIRRLDVVLSHLWEASGMRFAVEREPPASVISMREILNSLRLADQLVERQASFLFASPLLQSLVGTVSHAYSRLGPSLLASLPSSLTNSPSLALAVQLSELRGLLHLAYGRFETPEAVAACRRLWSESIRFCLSSNEVVADLTTHPISELPPPFQDVHLPREDGPRHVCLMFDPRSTLGDGSFFALSACPIVSRGLLASSGPFDISQFASTLLFRNCIGVRFAIAPSSRAAAGDVQCSVHRGSAGMRYYRCLECETLTKAAALPGTPVHAPFVVCAECMFGRRAHAREHGVFLCQPFGSTGACLSYSDVPEELLSQLRTAVTALPLQPLSPPPPPLDSSIRCCACQEAPLLGGVYVDLNTPLLRNRFYCDSCWNAYRYPLAHAFLYVSAAASLAAAPLLFSQKPISDKFAIQTGFEWGVRAVIREVLPESAADDLSADDVWLPIREWLRKFHSPGWRDADDIALLAAVRNAFGDSHPILGLHPGVVDSQVLRLANLLSVPLGAARLRLLLIQKINVAYRALVKYIDTSSNAVEDARLDMLRRADLSPDILVLLQKTPVGVLLQGVKHFLHPDTKEKLIETILAATSTSGDQKSVRLNRHRASRISLRQKPMETVFMQAFRQLKAVDPHDLRHPRRAFAVTFVGEGADDYGGPYHEALSTIVAELKYPVDRELHCGRQGMGLFDMEQYLEMAPVPLLMPCPNAQNEIGNNRERYLPNLRAQYSPACLQLFEFFGRLMGISFRTRSPLALDLHRSVYGYILDPHSFSRVALSSRSAPASLYDMFRDHVLSMDSAVVSTVDLLLDPAKHGIDSEAIFADAFGAYPFETRRSDGIAVELCGARHHHHADYHADSTGSATTTNDVSGADARRTADAGPYFAWDRYPVCLTWSNRQAFVASLMRLRILEALPALKAIRRGFLAIVPPHALSLLSSTELEEKVAGHPDVDVSLLQAHTTYEDCAATDPHIVMFWNVLRGADPSFRCGFLRFVSGRSRLPLPPAVFSLSIKNFTRAPPSEHDRFLPQSATCFFSIQLPRYSSESIMYDRMKFAIVNCHSIDTDFNVHPEDTAEAMQQSLLSGAAEAENEADADAAAEADSDLASASVTVDQTDPQVFAT